MEPRRRRYQDLAPLERIVFRSDVLRVGAFRAPTGHPRFADSGPIENHIFVFPRTSVGIQHEGRKAFFTDTRTVTFYNEGQRYARRPLDPRGDLCEWFAVRPDVLRDVLAAHDPAVRDRPERPFPFARGPSSAGAYLRQRLLVRHVLESEDIDSLAVDEMAVAILDEVVGLAYAAHGSGTTGTTGRGRLGGPPAASPGSGTGKRKHGHRQLGHRQLGDRGVWHREVGRREPEHATRLRRLLARRFTEPLSLDDMAEVVGVSVFHLCRVFRRATGTTIARHRNQLRLRRSLELVAEPGSDLTQVALDLGYSSHSHFTAAFRKAFDVTPSEFRDRASRRLIRELAEQMRMRSARHAERGARRAETDARHAERGTRRAETDAGHAETGGRHAHADGGQ